MKNLRVMFDVRDVVSDVNTVVAESVAQTTDNLTGVWGGGRARGGRGGRGGMSCVWKGGKR
jgi:hypothetical protein